LAHSVDGGIYYNTDIDTPPPPGRVECVLLRRWIRQSCRRSMLTAAAMDCARPPSVPSDSIQREQEGRRVDDVGGRRFPRRTKVSSEPSVPQLPTEDPSHSAASNPLLPVS